MFDRQHLRRYIGEFVNNLFEGSGVLYIPKSQHPMTKVWRRGERYEGSFLRGQQHGRGTWLTRSGDQYDGEVKNGRYEGKGVCVYGMSGDVYEGDFVRSLRYGCGELRFRDGSIYRGGFRLDSFHGFGHIWYGPEGVNGSYVGEFKDGKRQGQGIRTYGGDKSERRRYEGAWEDDEPHGKGVFERDGCTAMGTFERGLQNGPGTMRFANGDTYDGTFEKGDLHGEGRFVYQNGGIYEGAFIRSKRHGKGTRVFANGDRYAGDWVDDQMHGRGLHTSQISARPLRMTMKDGWFGLLIYEGDYKNGQQSGETSIIYELVLKEEQPVSADTLSQHNKINKKWNGEFEFPENSGCWHRGRGKVTYKGGVLRGRFHGQGQLRSPNGKSWSGEWSHGQLHGRGERVYLPLILKILTTNEVLDNDTQSLAREQNGLYGIVQYVGEFVKHVCHGEGEVLYTDGSRLRGQFLNGFVEGVACYGFNSQKEKKGDFRWRYGEFVRGERVRWLSKIEEESLKHERDF
ncbi:Junctional membrane complex protein Junctophilin and related MORN repeat proteins [Plasmopara halstedii]|uniref:Junctional membrane complex protein Junctophilin and related MORN repeat proteins n=1 Tax=Plasmopara halstedii TaxID=4781 RepID=A0A0P1AIL1_PLAHL|nr:Junctional membrane complex protein Junctophilin and related MORN repeat proteins [Plasmopara halstedii]CEG41133.1 Junctional membrane complex protein Junctophilin and related MORN repeat proteins [Plasmopara halstedii]|eukprot:XP_024577502.1 Junctional membrane complex protein Junctophilin and related MORN repeat proteins [Plasmopara halstedii]